MLPPCFLVFWLLGMILDINLKCGLSCFLPLCTLYITTRFLGVNNNVINKENYLNNFRENGRTTGLHEHMILHHDHQRQTMRKNSGKISAMTITHQLF